MTTGLRWCVVAGALAASGVILAACGGQSTASADKDAAPDSAAASGTAAAAPDLRAMRAADSTVLNGYGWVNREQGIAAIPIERAMQLIVERGSLEARKAP